MSNQLIITSKYTHFADFSRKAKPLLHDICRKKKYYNKLTAKKLQRKKKQNLKLNNNHKNM